MLENMNLAKDSIFLEESGPWYSPQAARKLRDTFSKSRERFRGALQCSPRALERCRAAPEHS